MKRQISSFATALALANGANAYYGVDPNVLTYTVVPVGVSTSSWNPILILPTGTSPVTVTVTTTRTFTDYCGCGIPGVSTIVGPIIGTTTTTTLTSTSTGTSTGTSTSSTSVTTTTTAGTSDSAVLTSTTSTASTSSSTSTTSSTSSSSSSTSTSTSSSLSTSSSTSTSTTSMTSTTTSVTTTTTSASTTTTSAGPVVTDEAYIDTVLRHHNVHRANHTAPQMTWSPSLAETARKIASSCVYGHNTSVDGGGYGQNIGAGFLATNMGQFITEGLYNSEVNSYTAYGGEPNTNDVGKWGHFTQIVWVSSTTVGCYTQDCSAQGLQNAPGIPPYFTVCNYSPAGNVVGAFGQNVLRPVGNPSVFAGYECPTTANCVGPTQ